MSNENKWKRRDRTWLWFWIIFFGFYAVSNGDRIKNLEKQVETLQKQVQTK